jgi:hypothetical protein
MYPALRSGRRYSSQSKTLHPKAQNQNNLRQEISEVKRNTAINSNILPDEEMDSESEEEVEFQMPASIPQTPKNITPAVANTAAKKTVIQTANPTNASTPKKKKYRMLPAQIESLTDFNVSEYLQSLPCGLTVGQAAHLLPKYRSGLNRATRRHRERLAKANMLGSDDNNEPTTAAKCTLRIEGRTHTAVVDSGAATSIITRPLLDRFEKNINRPSKLIVVTANGTRTRSLGIVDNININVGKLDFPTSFQVLESKDEVLILRNNWLRNAQALLDWNNSCLTVQKGLIATRIPVAFTKTSPVEFQPFSEHQEPFDF